MFELDEYSYKNKTIRDNLFIPLPLFTFDETWFCEEETSLISNSLLEYWIHS